MTQASNALPTSERDRCAEAIRKALAVVRPQFQLDLQDGVHGVAHWSRVWFHGKRLAQELDVNLHLLAWFAYLHDSRRLNDHVDPLHGSRAADFALKLRKAGVITELSARELEWLCEAMRLHSDGRTLAEPAIQACWDADRLDLGRVGITPRADLLCTAPAKSVDVIREAVRMSQRRSRTQPA